MTQFTLKPARLWERLPIVVSIVLLCGAAMESRKFRPPPDTAAYMARIRNLAGSQQGIPMVIGDWVGRDVPVDQSAVKLLHPNIIISRNYINAKMGMSASFLFVHCSDARDTIGHYPPICYPSQGYSQGYTKLRDWQLPGMTIHGTEYNFVRSVFDSDGDANGQLWVDDFFVLPQTGSVPDRRPVIAAAADLQRRFYGVAQVQLVFNNSTDSNQNDARRRAAFVELFAPIEGLFRTVQAAAPVRDSTQTAPPLSAASAKDVMP